MRLLRITHPLHIAMACALLVVLADFLFWHGVSGWTPGAFLLGLVAAVALRPECRGNDLVKAVSLAATIAAGAAFFYQPSALAGALGIVSLTAWAIARRGTWAGRTGQVVSRAAALVAGGWFRLFLDLPTMVRRAPRGGSCAGRTSREALLWILPLAIALVFLLLFTAANPLLARVLADVVHWIETHIAMPTVGRVLFWLFFGLTGWGLLRLRGKPLRRRPPALPQPTLRGPRAFVVRALLACNAVFALQNGIDLAYLWGGLSLPAGMTYAEYAHRGAYPLVFTALLAAAFVLVVFRDRAATPPDRLTRGLVYAWIGQNILLAFSSILRLGLYVDAYGLTLLRLSAMIWIGLVAFGLATIIARIIVRQTNEWLLNVNAVATLVVLFACAFWNMRGFVAMYNVEHAATARQEFDVWYAQRLGPEALPALYVLRDRGTYTGCADLPGTIANLEQRLEGCLDDPRGWSIRRLALAQLVAADRSG